MPAIRFTVQAPDGATTSTIIESDRVVLGCAAHCEVRLPEEDSAPEHVAVECLGDTIALVALALKPPATLDGNPITRATLVTNAILRIGRTSIHLERTLEAASVSATSVRSGHSALLRAVAGLLGVVALAMLVARAAAPGQREAVRAPDLWSQKAASCHAESPAQAAALAVEKELVADGKRERHPFYLADGLDAVQLYETAAACWGVGDDPSHAEAAVQAARQLRAQVDLEYRVMRLRLERSLATGDDETARRAVVGLRALLAGRSGPYLNWIQEVARKLEVDKENPS